MTSSPQEQLISDSLVCILPKRGFPCNCPKERGSKFAGDQKWREFPLTSVSTQVWALRGGSCYKLGSIEGGGVVREREAAMLSVYNQSYLALSIGEEVTVVLKVAVKRSF